MRSTIAACAILVLLGTANAEQCPPGALGVSRTLIVDPNEHPRVGSMQLHDIHQRTVLALPEILNEFKSRGYKIVHVVPAAADRPKTATSAQQWVARPTPEQHTSPSQMRPLRQGISRRRGQEPEPK